MKSHDVKSTVVNIDSLDAFGITKFYGGQLYPGTTLTTIRFLLACSTYKIIHVHAAYRFVKYFRRLYPQKKVVMHFHGEELRMKGWDAVKEILDKASLTLVSTQDLMKGSPSNVSWLLNPVDTKHFRPMQNLRTLGTALYLIKHQRGENISWPRKVAEQYGLKLSIYDRKANSYTIFSDAHLS